MRSSKHIRLSLFLCVFLLATPAFSQTIARVDVTAPSTVLIVGQTIPATAAAKDADGNVVPGASFTWTSGTPTVANVDSSGQVTALFPGSVQIRARTGSFTGNLNLSVIPMKVQLTGPDSVQLNSSTTFAAAALDINGSTIPNVTFTWASDNTSVGTVSNGTFQGLNLGEANVSATSANVTGRLKVRVSRPVDYAMETVVSTDPVPGQSNIQSIISLSNMNASGDLAFVANVMGSTAALVRESQGALTLLARTGDQAPLGGTFSSFAQPVINGRGDVAVVAGVGGGGIGPLLLLFRGGEAIPLLAVGDPFSLGGTIGSITLATDGLDDNGFAVVTLGMNNPSYSGVFRVSPETLVQPLIQTTDNTSIGSPTAFNNVAVSPGGRVVVNLTAGSRRGIFVVTPTDITPVAVDGGPNPGGGTFASFQAVRLTDLAIYILATPQGRAISLYRATTTLEEIVRGGATTNPARTTTLNSLLSVGGSNLVFSATLSDVGTGVYLWSDGNIRPVAVTRAAMPGGETLTRLDAAAISPSGEAAFLAVTNRSLSALYRSQAGTNALRWATASPVNFPVNFMVVSNSNLRPSTLGSYFLAGTPAGLHKKVWTTIAPVAMPGMITPRGHAFTAVSAAASNANGDAAFVGTSMDLTNASSLTILYRYFDNQLTEWIPFNQTVGGLNIGTGGLTNIALNSNRQVAFVGTVSNRQSLILAGSAPQVVLQAGAASPTGGTFSSFNNIQLTPAGSIVFSAAVTGGTAGIFMWSGGQITLVAGADVYRTIGAPVAGGENIYFSAARDTVTGLFAYTGSGTAQPIVSVGSRLPINTTITNIGAYAAQEDGTLVFQGTGSFTGVFVRRIDGTLSTVALVSETSPASGRFTSFVSLAMGGSLVLTNSLVTQDRVALFAAAPIGFQPPTISSVNFSIADRGAVSRTTENTQGPLTAGYAIIQPGPGSSNPSGLAIFSVHQNGIMVSEASVPATVLIQSGRIYAEVNGITDTGVAIANPNTQPATITFYFTDASGTDLGQGSFELPGGAQVARFLDQSPFNSGVSVSGTFTFSSSLPVSVISLRGWINERSEFLMTTLPVGPVGETSTASLIFPQYADGGGVVTQVVLVNSTDETATGSIEFIGADTQPVGYSIPPRTSTVVRTAGTAPTIQAGWVRVTPEGGTRTPSGLVIFSFKQNGVTVSQAGVLASPMSTAFRLFAESAGNMRAGQIGSMQTGIAVVNPSAASVPVTFELESLSGASAGLTGRITLPAQGHVALFMDQIPGLEAALGVQGVLRISAPAAIAVLGIRGRYNERGDFLMSTIPPSNEADPPATTNLYIPHFVDGGGVTTQFILFGGSAGQSSNGTLRFFSQTGQVFGLRLR